jgi:hypothetical protein
MLTLPELELLIHEHLAAFSPAARGALLHVLTLPDFERASRIGEFYSNSRTRTFAELLIDIEEDRFARAVVVGILRESERPR